MERLHQTDIDEMVTCGDGAVLEDSVDGDEILAMVVEIKERRAEDLKPEDADALSFAIGAVNFYAGSTGCSATAKEIRGARAILERLLHGSMTSDDGLQLSRRSHFYAMLDSAIASGSRCVHAPAVYEGDLDYDVTAYVEANRTVENGLHLWPLLLTRDPIVIADKRGTVLVIERVVQVQEAA